MRRRMWCMVAMVAVGAASAGLPLARAAAAAPMCTPGAPTVIGSGADRLTITVPGCSSEADITGYQIQVLATAAEAVSSLDVPVGTTQREITGLAPGTLHRFRVAARNADGTGPFGPRSADAVTPFTSARAMVERQYLDFAGTPVTSAQRATWLSELASGAKTPVELIDAAEQLPYWQRQSPVIRLYQAYFLRLPDRSGLSYWVTRFRNGTKITDISQQFARSSEFTRRYGTLSNRQFVEQIYLNVLGRPGETSGIDYWTGRLDRGVQNRGQVMVGFSDSPEYVRKTKEVVWTVNLHTGMVLRLPTTTEVDTWKSQSKAAQIVALLGSAEYAARVRVLAPGAAPGITTTSLPNGRVGTPYSTTVAASGGTGTLSWSRPSGTLPAGLSLSTTGTISGTPTAAGTSTFALRVTDSAGRSSQRTFTLTVTNFAITTASLPTAVVNTAYSQALAATGGSGALSWSLQSGAWPAGISMSSSGVISGTPATGGTANITVKVTDSTGSIATRTYSLVVSTFGITTTSVPNGTVGVTYSTTIATTGGTGGLSWDIASGTVPDGLWFFDGQLSGTPSKGGSFNFTVRVEDGAGQVRQRSYTIVVPSLVVTTGSLPDGVINTPYEVTLAAANAYFGTTWSLQSGALPAGTSLGSDGTISGTPTASGTANLTVKVTDDNANTATKALSITVSSYAIATTSVPGGYVGVPYAFALEAAGGTSYTWSITAGALPTGLALNASTGLISGTPTGTGAATFTAKVDSPGPKTASRSFTLPVTASADWPQADHDAAGTRHNPGDNAIGPTNVGAIGEEWSVTSGLQPVIVDGLVYAAGEVPGRTGTYAPMALDITTGEVVWYGPQLPQGCTSGPVAVTASAMIVSCGRLLAYSRTGSHALLWDTADTDPGVSSQQFVVSGSNAYTWGTDRVLAYRLSDGQRLWQQLLPSGAASVYDLAASGTSVVVAYDDRVRSLNATTGAQQWSRSAAGTAEVMIGGSWVYALVNGGMNRYALADGAPSWTVPASTGLFQLIGVDADTVYAFEAKFGDIGQESAVMRAYHLSNGAPRWETPLSTRVRSSAITAELVWVHTSEIFRWGRESALVALRRSDGAELRRISFADNSYGSAAWGNGHVVVDQGGSFGNPEPRRLRAFGLAPPAPVITTTMVPTGRPGEPYLAQLEATGGAGTRTWSIASGALPAGISLSPSGAISGTPSGTATARVAVRVTDAKGRSRLRTFNVWVVAVGTDSWTAQGQGAARTSYNPGETAIGRDAAAQLALRWKTAVPAGNEQTGAFDQEPVVANGRVFDVDRTGKLVVYATSGTTANRTPIWSRAALDGAYYQDVPVEAGGVLYLFDSTRKLDAVRASDGVRLWQVTVPSPPFQYPRNELMVVGSRILFLDGGYDMVARNTADGSAAWAAPVTLDGNELSGSVVLASDGTRAFVVANCEVKAITLATGAMAWTVPVKEGGTTNCGVGERMVPMVADGAVFATTYDGSVAIEAATGIVRWRSGIAGGFASGGGAIANGVWVLNAGSYDAGQLAALDLRTGEVLWQRSGTIGGAYLSVAGDLIVARSSFALHGYDLLTGEQAWDGGQVEPALYGSGGPTIANGRILVATRDGISAYGPP